MKKIICLLSVIINFAIAIPVHLSAQNISGAKEVLKQKYNLAPNHPKDTQYYEMESRLQKHNLDGAIKETDIYRFSLRCVSFGNPSIKDEYTCLKFTVQLNNSHETEITSLAGWKYHFSLSANTTDTKGEVFGIDHSKFEKLNDANGKSIPIENTYHIYNAFIDFHSMSVFTERTAKDSGVQNLQFIGDKIVHAAAFSQPPVNLGNGVAEGSYFKNGKITLEFKGIGLINDKACAIIEYDSDKSSFYMLMKPMPNMEVPTNGSSHYLGDIYKDLTTGWIQKAILHEFVISETNIPVLNTKLNGVIERSITIDNINMLQKKLID